jgi:hypothetical protein
MFVLYFCVDTLETNLFFSSPTLFLRHFFTPFKSIFILFHWLNYYLNSLNSNRIMFLMINCLFILMKDGFLFCCDFCFFVFVVKQTAQQISILTIEIIIKLQFNHSNSILIIMIFTLKYI